VVPQSNATGRWTESGWRGGMHQIQHTAFMPPRPEEGYRAGVMTAAVVAVVLGALLLWFAL